MRRRFSILCLASLLTGPLGAAELKILPGDMTLVGPHATQRVIVVRVEQDRVIADVTREAELRSSQSGVAALEGSILRATGDGEATLTATVAGQQTVARVKVVQTKEPFSWSFRNHVIPVLTKLGCNSGACHGALAGKGGLKLSLRGYAPEDDHFVLTRQAGSRRIDLQQPERSLFLRKPTLALAHGGGLKLEVESPEFRLLADWIANGAAGPRTQEPAVTRLEALPSTSLLQTKQKLQLVVRAWYSDGHSEDVTRWARFASTEDLVASVDDQGRVNVLGHGAAALTVVYANQVALSHVLVPLPNKLDDAVFAQAERRSYVDDLVLKKLAILRIPPSPASSDREFVRRAYLDAAGILPTPEEVQRFLADPRSDRRARLIDSLLERSEFVDYWAYKWSDLLLVSSRRLPQPTMWSFYQHIRQSVADNKPWDRFAREILTANGSNLQNGAANYFVLHKDVSDLTETTALTFMGMSITCARCHNHPLEKWTQDQYWGMANLFARVSLKNGERGGEVIVQSAPTGDALHLKKSIAMPPTPLDGKPLTNSMDRRAYFAEWLTAKDNPYFARALVNRVWRNFLGRGLVEAEDDLRQTNPASNEELLDALAADFVKHGCDVKRLVRTIMNSAAYQRSARPIPGNSGDDRFYARYLLRRLPAEVVLDAYAQVTGVPTVFNQIQVGSSGGSTPTTAFPPGTRALQLPDALVVSSFLDSFGRPDRVQTCSCERQSDSSVTQALHLNNGKTLNDKLRAKESRVSKWLEEKIGDEEALWRVFLLALSREPEAKERQRFLALMAEAGREPQSSRREILEDLFWAVLTGREFLFNH